MTECLYLTHIFRYQNNPGQASRKFFSCGQFQSGGMPDFTVNPTQRVERVNRKSLSERES